MRRSPTASSCSSAWVLRPLPSLPESRSIMASRRPPTWRSALPSTTSGVLATTSRLQSATRMSRRSSVSHAASCPWRTSDMCNPWVSRELYRTLTTRFGYPEFLRLGKPENQDRPSMLAALESSLRYKSPPAEETVRHALEADVPLEDILAAVVDFYGQWTVGEKEHTISYLNAVLQTSKFLGKEEALLPLAIGLSKLPF